VSQGNAELHHHAIDAFNRRDFDALPTSPRDEAIEAARIPE
jgi:hypothetical protein